MTDKNIKTEKDSNHKITLDVKQKTSIWSKVILILSALFGIFALFFNKSTDKINKEIAEKKIKDNELKHKAEEIEKNIKELEQQSEKLASIITEKEKNFNDFVQKTLEESKEFEAAKKSNLDTLNDTENNVDWVKAKFKGSVDINEK